MTDIPQRCPHTEVLATGGWCKCGALVKVTDTAPALAPERATFSIGYGGAYMCSICGLQNVKDNPCEHWVKATEDKPTGAPTGTPPETCPRCWGHGCYLCNHQGTCEPTAAPTGTGEGSESTAHLYIPKAQYDAKVAKLNAEYAALRSQLEEARDYGAHWNGKYIQAERDLATAQARIAELEEALREFMRGSGWKNKAAAIKAEQALDAPPSGSRKN